MKKLLFILFSSFPGMLFAQQLPLYSQYLLNDFSINPAIAGSKPYSPLKLNVRNQWSGFGDNTPQTNSLSFHAPLSRGKMGLGGVVFQDKTGPNSQFGIMFSYAYHTQLSDGATFSLGLSGLINQNTLNQDELTFKNPDSEFESGSYSSTVPDAAFGVFLQGENYFLGASAFQLFESTFREASVNLFGDNDMKRHYFLHAGFVRQIHNDFQIEPSVLLKTVEAGPVQADFNARAVFNKSFWSGISYRTSNTFAATLGIRLGTFQFTYAYDYSLSSVGSNTAGSHELSVGLNLNQQRFRRHTNFW